MSSSEINNNTKTACVTGATGFIASHIVQQLLQQGYTVHGTVRSVSNKSKNQFLLDLPNAKTHLKLFEANLLEENSFDEAVKNCSVVYHTASPFFMVKTDDPMRDFVDPAVKGTLNVLRSCATRANGGTVKRVVLTSSVASIFSHRYTTPLTRDLTEEDWNTESDPDTDPYLFSKTEAEKAAWSFVQENETKISFDLVTVLPSMVIGPKLKGSIDKSTISSLNASSDFMYQLVKSLRENNKLSGGATIQPFGFGFVDVRDVAKLHILCGETREAKGRVMATAQSLTIPSLAQLLIDSLPEEFSATEFRCTEQMQREALKRCPRFDHSKSVTTFPSFTKYMDIKTSVLDTVQNFKDLELL